MDVNTGKMLSHWGHKGSGRGEFCCPEDICVVETTEGKVEIYVADMENHRIQVLTEQGEFLRSFGSPGTGNDQFNRPRGVAVDVERDRVYVTDCRNNRISVFSTNGAWLTHFGTGSDDVTMNLHVPYGLHLDPSKEFLYVADYGNHRVVVLSALSGKVLHHSGSLGSGEQQYRGPTAVLTFRDARQVLHAAVSDYNNSRITLCK